MSQIPQLHALYCQLTGLHLPLDVSRERDWFEWLRRVAPPSPEDTETLAEDAETRRHGDTETPLSASPRLPISASDQAEHSLRLVIAHLQRGIREGKRNPGALKFRNLIGMPDYFEEDLAEARALARGKRSEASSQRSATLRATGRTDAKAKHDPAEAPARTPAQIMAAAKAFAEFRKFKDTLTTDCTDNTDKKNPESESHPCSSVSSVVKNP